MPRNNPYRDNFLNFLWYIWKHLGLPEPTPVQYDIAKFLQHGPRRLMIEAFRGVGKSWITAAFVCWCLYRDPQMKIMVVSASKERSDAFSIFVKQLINDVPILSHLKSRPDQRKSTVAFDVGPATPDQSPSVKSVGITGQLTGSRADIIIPDDIETPKNSLTALMRERLGELIKEFDAVLKPNGRVLYLGTPQTEMSLYNQLPERGYQLRVWPARIPGEKTQRGYGDKLAPYVEDLVENGATPLSPMDPDRFDDIDLLEREASYGRSGFALQFMLDTSLSDGDRYPLKMSDLIVTDLDPERAPVALSWGSGPDQLSSIECVGLTGDRVYRPMNVSNDYAEYTGAVMFVDPSGRGKDETSYAVVKILNGKLFLTASGGLLGGYDDSTMKTLAVVAKNQKVNLVLVESNFGDGMFTQLLVPHLTRIHPVATEEVRAHGQKELRIIDTLEPLLNQHRLVVDATLVRADQEADPPYQLFYQLTRLTKDKGALPHDDRLDALEGACRYWVEHMSRDEEQAADDHRAEALKAELQRHLDHQMGRSSSISTGSFASRR